MNVMKDFIPAEASVALARNRLESHDWNAFADEMDSFGCAVLKAVLTPEECRELAGLYPDETYFRSHVHMARHGFGKGEYRYFKYPLPDLLGGLRSALWPHLAEIANSWNERMGLER